MKKLELIRIEQHLFSSEHLKNVHRSTDRVKSSGEHFTPIELVREVVDKLEENEPQLFTDSKKTFLDHSCGDGQFLAYILYKKLKNNIDFESALSSLYGVDIMEDNVETCRARLLCGRREFQPIVDRQIVIADALKYHYRFDDSWPYDDDRLLSNLD